MIQGGDFERGDVRFHILGSVVLILLFMDHALFFFPFPLKFI